MLDTNYLSPESPYPDSKQAFLPTRSAQLPAPQDAFQYPLLDLSPSSPFYTLNPHDVLILQTRGLACTVLLQPSLFHVQVGVSRPAHTFLYHPSPVLMEVEMKLILKI